MMIELPEKLAAALKVQANAHGVSPAGYVRDVLERNLASALEGQSSGAPLPPEQEANASNGTPALTGADLVAAMQASPCKEIDLQPTRDRSSVRDVEL